ncbi:MAG: 2-hydroxy-3-oxopropionate reductase [Lacrimispora sp.]|jgi:2-hydroxy-3-oxopropionate reductase|nr:2-hydroxy-3-oxopropionate reductase [Lacrimispora sp.]
MNHFHSLIPPIAQPSIFIYNHSRDGKNPLVTADRMKKSEDNHMKIGFIGLGIMGRPMAKNLLKAGHELVVFDFNKEAVADLVSNGATSAETGKELASQCDVVITMVPNSPHVRAAVLGENGVAEGAKSGTVVIDMSSIDPTESRAIGAELEKLGIDMLDAPVSGGEPKAIDGTLSVMVGGKKELFDKYYDMLMVVAGSVVYVGELGAGNVAKLANQIVVAVNIAAVSEALTFAKKAGTDPELVYQAIRGGLAGSTVMDAKAPMMLNRNFKPGFRIELHIKDLNNALNAAHNVSSPVPLTGQLMEIMQGLKADGFDKEDHSSIVKYYEKIANTTVEPQK